MTIMRTRRERPRGSLNRRSHCKPSRGTRLRRRLAWLNSLSSEELKAYEERVVRRYAERGQRRPGGNRPFLWELRFGSGRTRQLGPPNR
jgi:hypothetical protein